MKTLFEAKTEGGATASVALLTEPEDVGRLISLFDAVAHEQGWQPGGQIEACRDRAHHLAILEGDEIVGGLQVVVGRGAALPYRSVWPEVDVWEGCAAHVTILALAREHRGKPGLFWPLCVELWRWCDGRGVGTILMEATPATLRVYRRLGWPLEVVGDLRVHWGEGCYLCRCGVREMERSIVERAQRSAAYGVLVEQGHRR